MINVKKYMSIYISKNNEQSGPFEESDVRDRLRRGDLSTNDMAIRQGDAGWQRLGEMFPDVKRATEPAASTAAAAGSAVPLASNTAQAVESKGGCKTAAGIVLMVFGAIALLGGAGLALATPYIYTTPSCDFAESDWKEIQDLKKKYDAEDDTYEKASIEIELKSAMAGYDTSAKHCADQKSTMRTFQIGEGAIAFVGLLMIIVGFIVRRL